MTLSIENLTNTNDIVTYFELHGSGEPLLLLHGFSGSSKDWHPLISAWSNHFKLIIPDLRGHGRTTSTPKQPYTLRQVSLDMWALLESLNINKFNAIGISGGGNVLLHMATQQPDRINAMTLISATSHYPEQCREFMRQGSFEKLSSEQLGNLRKSHPNDDTQIRQLFEYARHFAETYDDINFTTSDLSKIKAKTLLIQGDKDFLYPIDITIDMFKAIPTAALWIVPNAGHVPLIKDEMDHFFKITNSFFLTGQLGSSQA
jgi:pimeloyl-ACP methyl ester carboxylesterase